MREEQARTIRIGEMKVGAILNTSSGSCDEESEAKMLLILKEAGIKDPQIWCGGADQVSDAFKAAFNAKLDVLIVLGGDGTIRTAAELAKPQRPYLIPLPGGTINTMPKALYGGASWEDALRATLADPVVRTLSGGEVQGQQFFISAVIGAPSLWAEAREAVREGDIRGALEKGAIALQNTFAITVRYDDAEGDRGEAESLSVICPFISAALEDSEQALEVAAFDVKNAAEVIALATHAAFGKWRDDEHIILTKSKHVHVESETDIPAFLDGETVNLGREAHINFISEAFSVMVPRAHA